MSTPNLPMLALTTRELTFETACWSYDFANLWAARGDALMEAGVPRYELSIPDQAAQHCVRFYLDELTRLASDAAHLADVEA